MMEKFKKLVRHPLAVLLALVPGLNLIYLVLLLVFVEARRLFLYLIGIGIPSIGVFYLNHLLVPAGFEYLALYGYTVLLSVACLFLLRPVLQEVSSLPKYAKIRVLIVVGILSLVILLKIFMPRIVDLKIPTETMLQSIIDGDDETFNSVCYGKGLTLESVQQALSDEGITLHDPISLQRTVKRHFIAQGGKTIKDAEYIYRIGSVDYSISVVYTSSQTGEGISEIRIRRIS